MPTDVLQAVLQKNNLELASSGLGFLSVALASSDLGWHSCTNIQLALSSCGESL